MKRVIAVSLLSLCPAAFAAPAGGTLDVYFIPKSDVDFSGTATGKADGDGFGLRGLVKVAPQLALTAEYQTVDYDNDPPPGGFDLDQFRVGAGLLVQGDSGVFVEYIDGEFSSSTPPDNDLSGFAVHGRLAGDVAPNLSLHGQFGYAMLESNFLSATPAEEDLDGIELLLGGTLHLNRQFGVLAEYRLRKLEGDTSNAELEIGEFRAGARLMF